MLLEFYHKKRQISKLYSSSRKDDTEKKTSGYCRRDGRLGAAKHNFHTLLDSTKDDNKPYSPPMNMFFISKNNSALISNTGVNQL
jgi:hypothetical protein